MEVIPIERKLAAMRCSFRLAVPHLHRGRGVWIETLASPDPVDAARFLLWSEILETSPDPEALYVEYQNRWVRRTDLLLTNNPHV
jgi:hypothetical protein